jgi:hypothetical protein
VFVVRRAPLLPEGPLVVATNADKTCLDGQGGPSAPMHSPLCTLRHVAAPTQRHRNHAAAEATLRGPLRRRVRSHALLTYPRFGSIGSRSRGRPFAREVSDSPRSSRPFAGTMRCSRPFHKSCRLPT